MLKQTLLLLNPDDQSGGSLPSGTFSEDSPGGSTLTEEAQSVDSNDIASDVFDGDVFEIEPKKPEQQSTTLTEKEKLQKLEKEKEEIDLVQSEQAKKDAAKKAASQPKKDEILKEEVEGESEDLEEKQSEDKKEAEEDKKRDYTGLSEKDVEFLKKQPNKIFAVVAPILKEKNSIAAKAATIEAELKKFREDPNRIPDNWYENERAIELTPEYQQLSALYDRVTYETEHAQAQINRLDAGLGYTVLTGYDSKTGQYTVSQEIPHPGEDKAKLVEIKSKFQKSVNSGVAQQSQYQQKAAALAENFKKQHIGINTYYDEAITKHFGKLPEQLKPLKEHEDMYKALVHPAHKDSSQTKMAAKMFSVLLRQGEVIKALRAEKNKNKKIEEDRKVAGPTNTSSQQGSGVINRLNPRGSNGKLKIGEDGRVSKDTVIDFNSLSDEMNGEQAD